ncbi:MULTISPECIES: SDR family oxidoreductase [Paracoccus]|uniref:SDR family oxidoreductase n=1 Tax=Paracoccus TaxID=265 RepID=UPI001FB73BD3|nr:SDR family oxidoreductase [Paracoccus sp. AS002]MCJ1899505.1 SDR family oxidoreductase [Paracoccus versutus]MDF3904768.1 SDR family oxidoreductase [Paracoccus sp. AS002]
MAERRHAATCADGGAAGFGLEATRKFVENGACVVVADIQDAARRAIKAELPGEVRFIRCGMRCEAGMQAPVDLAVAEFGGLDVMHHNAGTLGSAKGMDEISAEARNAAMEMLQTAIMLAIKVAAPALKARTGAVVLTSSAVGCAYAIAKASVCQIGRHAALTPEGQGTRVNVIVSGAFKTAVGKAPAGAGHAAGRQFARMQPLPLTGPPRCIADAALFLASGMSDFVSGVVRPVKGGLTLHRNSRSSAEG